ncbi:MAG: NADPH-dependent 7-cyano-7-deazaguanine reductase QueF [Rhodocyclaceae bacterium]|nr:NADPH-dependent 7-cyano-7-deazaguanine reductase QueF [Rhodocyclaceae bacterium]MBX3670341.1 NADPH-dependent 7-cyano-7-deazaguanine reductase QueF [Rhodocyclaceae bacterium]
MPLHQDAAASGLGRATEYPSRYDARLLFPIARAGNRAGLGLGVELPFKGVDIWNAYELSWLDRRGKPVVATAELSVPADTPCLVESKSLKLYLNSFNQERLAGAHEFIDTVERDLSTACGGPVSLKLSGAGDFAATRMGELAGISIDDIEVEIDTYDYDPTLLTAGGTECCECLRSDLLKSNCPVTGQPDWASVQICYSGPAMDRAALLRYIVSFRQHAGFHEHCVEMLFMDILARCAPRELSIYARYTRRGGLDINPFRSTCAARPPNNLRNARQ